MIRNLIKQLWNSRRVNGWIFGEMVIVFVAMWLVIDPLYTSLYQINGFENGFEPEKLYVLDVELKQEATEEVQEEDVVRDFNTIQQLLQEYPGVEATAPVKYQYVWSASNSSGVFMNPADTARKVGGQMLTCFQGSDYFKTFRFRDAASGSYLRLDSISYQPNVVFITENVEEILFGKGKGVGKELRLTSRTDFLRVVGVIKNVKGYNPIEQATPLIISYQPACQSVIVSNRRAWNTLKLAFRIHDHESETLFLERFKKELLPRLSVGGLAASEITSIQENGKELLNAEGVSGMLELQIILVLFFLINILLAVFAAFWLRVRKRRGEIGVMLALGNSAGGIKKYFLTESVLLFGCSSLVGLVVLAQILYFKGGMYVLREFSQAEQLTSVYRSGWPINHDLAHFAIVTLFTLVILGGTILLGTWLPAWRASRIQPSNALREE